MPKKKAKNKYKVVIAGSRSFEDYSYAEPHIIEALKGRFPSDVEIVSGGARGADKVGEEFAKKFKMSLKRFPADWKTHGKSAGHIRNLEMAEYADAVLLFWDGHSKGTLSMKTFSENAGLWVKVILV